MTKVLAGIVLIVWIKQLRRGLMHGLGDDISLSLQCRGWGLCRSLSGHSRSFKEKGGRRRVVTSLQHKSNQNKSFQMFNDVPDAHEGSDSLFCSSSSSRNSCCPCKKLDSVNKCCMFFFIIRAQYFNNVVLVVLNAFGVSLIGFILHL